MRYLPAKIRPAASFCSYNLGISVLLLSKAVIAQICQKVAYIRARKGQHVELQSVPPQRRKTHPCHAPGEMDFLCFMFWVVSLHSMYIVLLCATTIKVSKPRIARFQLKSGTETVERRERGRLCFSSGAGGTDPEATVAEMCQGNRDTEKPNWNHHLPSIAVLAQT